MVENGEASKNEEEGKAGNVVESNEKDEGVVIEKENVEANGDENEEVKEEMAGKTVEHEVENHCDSIENADDGAGTEDAGESANLIKEADEGKGKEKQGKKNKKKEGSRWICGLGKKSNKEKGEKKKKEEKKGKKGKTHELEEAEEEGIPENEKKLIDGENDGNKEEDQTREDEVKKEEVDTEGGEENAGKNEEVVVYVTESEAVVEETHQNEDTTENKEECSVKGDGLVKGKRGQETSFQIHSLVDDVFNFTSKIQDGNGNEVVAEIEHVEGNIHKATYYPSTTGVHTIEALWKGQHVSGSPFQVTITDDGED